MNVMIKKTLYILVCVVFVACSAKTEVSIPDTILSKQKMLEVMIDVHLLEASMNLNVYNPDRTVVEDPTPGFDILKKNSITKQQFDESFGFYSQHPNLLNELYDNVLDSLSKMQAEVMNKK